MSSTSPSSPLWTPSPLLSSRSLLPHYGERLLLLLLLCLLLPSLALSTASSPPSESTSPSTLRVPRIAVPTFAPIHVLSVQTAATPSHGTLPLDVLKELGRRGHHITYAGLKEYEESFVGSAEDRAALSFHFAHVPEPGSYNDTTGLIEPLMPRIQEDWIAALDEVSRVVWEPLWAPSYRTLKALVERQPPDVMLCDVIAFACIDLAHQLAIPFVVSVTMTLGATSAPKAFDTPSPFLIYSQRWHEQPWWHRFVNTFLILPSVFFKVRHTAPRLDAIRAAHGVQPSGFTPSAKWAGRDVLVGSNWAWEWADYQPPYVHFIGPTRTYNTSDRLIEPALRQWLDERQHKGQPVVVLALGSTTALTAEEQLWFARALASCPALPHNHSTPTTTAQPFHILWVTGKVRPLSTAAKEVLGQDARVERWMAQPSVLAHPAVAVFLSHGGASSIQQSISVGLPLVVTPMFADQLTNGARLQDTGAGRIIDHRTASTEQLCLALRDAAFSADIAAAMAHLQRIFHQHRHGALYGADVVERAAIGQRHLLPYREREDVSAIIRYNVDVYAAGALLAVLVIGGTAMAVWAVGRACMRTIAGAALGGREKTKRL